MPCSLILKNLARIGCGFCYLLWERLRPRFGMLSRVAACQLAKRASTPGLTFGIVGGLLILFEFFLWPRKTLFRVWRIGRTQTRLRCSIWLGLLTVPLVVLHSWRELGGTLTTALVLLFASVIASGIWGLVLQQFLPRAMLAQVPAETIYTQIDFVVDGFLRESRMLVASVCEKSLASNAASIGAVGNSTEIVPISVETFADRAVESSRARPHRGPSSVEPTISGGRGKFETLETAFVSVIAPICRKSHRVILCLPIRCELPVFLVAYGNSFHPKFVRQSIGWKTIAISGGSLRCRRGCISGCTVGCGCICRCRRLVAVMLVHVFVAVKFW